MPAFGIEELTLNPIEFYLPMRATIEVGIDPACLTNNEGRLLPRPETDFKPHPCPAIADSFAFTDTLPRRYNKRRHYRSQEHTSGKESRQASAPFSSKRSRAWTP